ncbi:hypothetical protein C8F04DRAFT_1408993 [Mycena alexandri]|uniref:Uncharacterized protein n=1 Tax=Mycena alexandri TaxID=1745969 RepID=A0AAD6WKN2_9AGAR|nr:hypothetical protein C8F04DRAFT_1408993 [Mycena alexandri]
MANDAAFANPSAGEEECRRSTALKQGGHVPEAGDSSSGRSRRSSGGRVPASAHDPAAMVVGFWRDCVPEAGDSWKLYQRRRSSSLKAKLYRIAFCRARDAFTIPHDAPPSRRGRRTSTRPPPAANGQFRCSASPSSPSPRCRAGRRAPLAMVAAQVCVWIPESRRAAAATTTTSTPPPRRHPDGTDTDTGTNAHTHPKSPAPPPPLLVKPFPEVTDARLPISQHEHEYVGASQSESKWESRHEQLWAEGRKVRKKKEEWVRMACAGRFFSRARIRRPSPSSWALRPTNRRRDASGRWWRALGGGGELMVVAGQYHCTRAWSASRRVGSDAFHPFGAWFGPRWIALGSRLAAHRGRTEKTIGQPGDRDIEVADRISTRTKLVLCEYRRERAHGGEHTDIPTHPRSRSPERYNRAWRTRTHPPSGPRRPTHSHSHRPYPTHTHTQPVPPFVRSLHSPREKNLKKKRSTSQRIGEWIAPSLARSDAEHERAATRCDDVECGDMGCDAIPSLRALRTLPAFLPEPPSASAALRWADTRRSLECTHSISWRVGAGDKHIAIGEEIGAPVSVRRACQGSNRWLADEDDPARDDH